MSKSVYLYSTLTGGNIYPVYVKTHDLPAIEQQIFVAGGANMPGNGKDVPPGAVTKVTPEQYALLKENRVFQMHVEGGYIVASEAKVDPELVASDMTARDGSAPLTAADVSVASVGTAETDAAIATSSGDAISRPANPRRA